MKLLFALCCLSLSCFADTGSALTQKEADDLVAYHNKVRKEVGSPPVKWSNDLAKYAQEWADTIAKTGEAKHRPSDEQKYGENIAYSTAKSVSVGSKMWHDEIKFYKPGEVVPDDFAKWKAGHYSQMVWSGTTSIGAGKAIIKTGSMKGWLVVVCNYDPAGNVVGEKPY